MENTEIELNAEQIQSVDMAFADKVQERKALSEIYGQLITKDVTSEVALEARNLRLRAVKVKKGVEKIHKRQKEYSLAFGRYCDSWKNKETEPIQQIIDGALEIEKFEEIKEKERLVKLHEERVSILSPYVDDPSERDLCKFEEDEFQAFFLLKKKQHEEKIESEKQAEIQRLEELRVQEEKRLLMEKENERLKKEAEEREKIAKIEEEKRRKEAEEREKITKARGLELQPYIRYIRNYTKLILSEEAEYQLEFSEIKKGAQEHLEFEIAEKIKAEQERVEKQQIEEELRKKSQIEREQREKAEAELRAKEQQERERIAEVERLKKAEADKLEAEKQAELNKGDQEKVIDLVNDLKAIKGKYTFESRKNQEMYFIVNQLIDKTIENIQK